MKEEHKKNMGLIALVAIVLIVALILPSAIAGKGQAGGGGGPAACNDDIDNDGDGYVDTYDPGCTSKRDTSELNPGVECDDGTDNDGDGLADSSDSGCSSPSDNDETNCGDNVCEGGETQGSCPQDCGYTECNDGIDNDGDYAVDLNDSGCIDPMDDDETNCGDGVCEGTETKINCQSDCGIPNSCSDTDNGFYPNVQGTISGIFNESPYNYTDSCNGTVVIEYYCAGTYPSNYPFDCAANGTMTCINGACA